MNQESDSLPGVLKAAAERFGSRLAYAEAGKRMSWQELSERVDAVAAGLLALGVERGDRVAICAENSIDWLTACHATLRAGAIAVPVYHDLQRGEIDEHVRRPRCKVLFASGAVLDKLGGPIEGVEHVIALGGKAAAAPYDIEGLAARATEETRAQLDARTPAAGDVALIVYTSGTTGGAKGVMLTHHNLLSNSRAAIQALGLNGEDSSLLVLPLHHALPFVAAVVIPPLIGAHFVIENDIRRMRERLQEYKPTIFFGVPALYELVYRNILARAEAEGRLQTLKRVQRVVRAIKRLTGVNLAPFAFRSIRKALGGRLKYMVSGGAALNPQTVLDFSSLGLPLLQGWGMTEASPVIAVQTFSRRRFLFTNYYERHAGSVGAPIPGVEVRLADVPEKGIRAAEAGEGEVQVRGPNVFPGYWEAEAETGAAMDGDWLRTGDMGRFDAEGNIYLTGRSKYVIVLESGEKVHPDELEALLAQSELLQDVCITGREIADNRSKRTHVTALVYASVAAARERSPALDEASLRRMVAEEIDRSCKQLAAYKRVTRIELSSEPLPKTALRKVARGSLKPSYELDFQAWLASAGESDR